MRVEFIKECASLDIDPNDPDLGNISEGHVCKHHIRWPHECKECEEDAYKLYKLKEKYGV